ncbi:MAG: ribose-phosphate pyrophosphokinase [Geminicoccaceae bacterium]
MLSHEPADVDRLEAILIDAARQGTPLTYSHTLFLLGRHFSRPKVRWLVNLLSLVGERTKARGEPDLAVLVVRQSDGLPGAGFFDWLKRLGRYDGPSTGAPARAIVETMQRQVFDYWRAR